MNKICVIGGGPAGLMAAGQAAMRGLEVCVLERNPRCARKLLITGKGRCNLTNATFDLEELVQQIPTNSRFLYSAFFSFMPYDTISFFEDLGVSTKIERGGRVFPTTDKAVTVVDAIIRFAERSGASILHERAVSVSKREETFYIKTEEGSSLTAEAVIIATGGKSYPLTGSTGDGYRFAQSLGHTIIPPRAALVPINCHEYWCSDLQGLSLKNTAIKITKAGHSKIVYSDFGEMLFTHFGVSGPMILSASSHLKDLGKERYELHIDLKPALSESQLEHRFMREFEANCNKDFINSLGALLPNKMIPVIIKLSKIPPSIKCNQITKEMRHNLVLLLKNLTLTLKSFRPIEEAIITSGGVKVSEINPKTMQSQLVKNLYFAGEVIDVDAYTGGFNLQVAFSTGYLAGTKILDDMT